MRLDVYLTESGLTKSRSQASECIKSGLVSVNGKTDVKPSFDVSSDDEVILLGKPHCFVGRGGLKLDHALGYFGVDVSGMMAVDIGASTGGFTDCLLQRGAKFVLAVDSGHGQLDTTLLSDERVRSLEGFNARDLAPDVVGFSADIAVTDVSFISQTLVIPPAFSVLKEGGVYVGLIKPQFECGASALGKNGIVKDKKHHVSAILKVAQSGKDAGFSVFGITPSPIVGGDGNREFLLYMKKSTDGLTSDKIVALAEEVSR